MIISSSDLLWSFELLRMRSPVSVVLVELRRARNLRIAPISFNYTCHLGNDQKRTDSFFFCNENIMVYSRKFFIWIFSVIRVNARSYEMRINSKILWNQSKWNFFIFSSRDHNLNTFKKPTDSFSLLILCESYNI